MVKYNHIFEVKSNHRNWLLQLQYSMVASTNIPNSYYNQNLGHLNYRQNNPIFWVDINF